MSERPEVKGWLMTALFAVLLGNFLLAAALMGAGDNSSAALESTALSQADVFRKYVETDSWRPMLEAFHHTVGHPDGGLYDLFFRKHLKFQYPPTSVMLFHWLPDAWIVLTDGRLNETFRKMASWGARLSVLWTILGSTLILGVSAGRRPFCPGADFWMRLFLCAALALLYFPLTWGYALGQIQIFIDALVTMAVLLQLSKREFTSGVCLGLCALAKPQYALFILWALLRKKWKFVLGFAAVFAAGLSVSLALFGFQDHLDYLRVLKEISFSGEAYWPNQSVNGLLNRWFWNGDAVHFSDRDYAPYHPWVHAGTALSTVLFIGAALWPAKKPFAEESASADFCAVLVAATIASPIAWEHHYGVLLPVFAAMLPAFMRLRPFGKMTGAWLLASYVLLSEALMRPEILLKNRWTWLLASHFFYGGLILFMMLLVLRRKKASQA